MNTRANSIVDDDDEMLDEYDFSGGVRGKYADRLSPNLRIIILDDNDQPIETMPIRPADGAPAVADAQPAARHRQNPAHTVTEAALASISARPNLMRIHGIGQQYAGLLRSAGVESISTLARQDAAVLASRITAKRRARHVSRPPSLAQIKDWIQQAPEIARQ
ncbi:MAG: DUF4332 domain-containing protein [Chloroflexota bacterium]